VGDRFIAIHLKMTGKLWIGAVGERSKDDRVVLTFASGKLLRFEDQRKFGWLQNWAAQELTTWERLQGPEPIPRLPADWAAELQSRRAIKAVLLDQAVVAGIGNIYADEILFRAGIHPERRANTLSAVERRRLTTAVEKEMRAAVDEREGVPDQKRVGSGDRTVKSLFRWRVFQREGEPCVKCGTAIVRTVVAGRGTYLCPVCQLSK
jgi:formamidopyrimidine-DNA glycosylase